MFTKWQHNTRRSGNMTEIGGTVELISPAAALAISQTREYLESVIVNVIIETEEQKINAITLGNELQKKYKELDGIRMVEKRQYDQKGKDVQARFVPVLDLIDEKKAILAKAITIWDAKLEEQRKARVRELQQAADRERARLDSLAGSRAERAASYLKAAEESLSKAQNESLSMDERAQAQKDFNYFNQKYLEFDEKATSTAEAALRMTAPVVEMETPGASKGSRKLVAYGVIVRDKKRFVQYCLAIDNLHWLMVDEKKLKTRAKETEGKNPPEGIEYTIENKTSFSGR